MSEASAVSKVFYVFLLVSFATGFALICFTDTRPAPAGKILQFHAKSYPHHWPLRTCLLLLLLLLTGLAFFAVFKENHRLNTVLAILVFILFIVEISFAIKKLTWRNEQSTIVESHADGNTMLQQYEVVPQVTKIVDFVQMTYSCCGINDYRDWAATAWALKVQKSNAVPQTCCKLPAPGCGDDLDIKDPFENIYVQGCTQLVYFSKDSDFIHGGVGMAVVFLHWCAVIGCILLSCAVNAASGLSPIQALKGEEAEQSGKGSGAGGHAGRSSPTKNQAKPPAGEGSRKRSGDDLDFAEENRPPKGARGMLIDKSELESDYAQQESDMSRTLDNAEH